MLPAVTNLRSVDELLTVAKRLLGADHVRPLAPRDSLSEASDHVLSVRAADGYGIEARFDAGVSDRAAKEDVLRSLADIFAGALRGADADDAADSADVQVALEDALVALSKRVHADGAAIVDALSPFVWAAVLADGARLREYQPVETADDESPLAPIVDLAAARAQREARERGEAPLAAAEPEQLAELTELHHHRSGRLVVEAPPGEHDEPTPALRRVEAAIEALRAETSFRQLTQGGSLHHTALTSRCGWSARSFAGVYAVVLAFEKQPDDLSLAHLARAVPTLEKLIVRMPPREPPPARVGAARRLRRS